MKSVPSITPQLAAGLTLRLITLAACYAKDLREKQGKVLKNRVFHCLVTVKKPPRP
jgi:hypothetical protein